VIFALGILTAVYSFYYWCTETQIENTKRLVGIFSISLVLGYLIHLTAQSSFWGDSNWQNYLTYTYFQVLALTSISAFYLRLYKTKLGFTFLDFGIVLSSGSALILPSLMFFIESTMIHYLMYNSIFFAVAIGYSLSHVRQSRLEEKENKELLRIIAIQEERSIEMNSRNEEQNLVIQELNEELEQFKQLEQRKEQLLLEFAKYDLTPREQTVALFILEGKSNREIADIENVSVGTIRTHAMKVYSKTGITGNKKEKLLKIQDKFLRFVQ
jgi:DNA-binding CsgD family transcriptional regulator